MNVSKFAGSMLAHQGGGYQPQRKDNFAVLIAGLQNLDVVALSVAKASIPALKMTQGKVKHFNETTFYAGSRAPTDGGTITIIDYLDKDLVSILAQWYKQVYNPTTGGVGFAADYKRTGEILLLPPGTRGGFPGAVLAESQRKFRMHGVWPMEFKYDDLSHEDDGGTPAQITLTLSVDRCIPISME